MFRRDFTLLLLIVLATFASVATIRAQEVEDTIRIKTRVVFLDALVKDRKTNLPISNLTRDNFQVLDDGKPREISYFTSEGDAKKPLALIMILDLRVDGAGGFLKATEILNSMENELAKLPPGDEVAILAMNGDENEQRVWLSEFTNERARIADALKQVQAICIKNSTPRPEETAAKDSADKTPEETKQKTVVSTETNKGRNGAVTPSRKYFSAPQSKSTNLSSSPLVSCKCFSTRTASRTTSGPMPSPGITAILFIVCTDCLGQS